MLSILPIDTRRSSARGLRRQRRLDAAGGVVPPRRPRGGRRSGRLGSHQAAGLRPAHVAVTGWDAHVEREVARYEDGEARLPGLTEADDRQRQLTRMGNAAGGAGLALLMDGRRDEAGDVVRPRRRALPRELPRGAAGQLGTSDRRGQGAPAGRRLGRGTRGRRVGARRPRERCGVAHRPLCGVPGAARPRPRRRGARPGGLDPGPRRLSRQTSPTRWRLLPYAMPTPTERQSAPSCARSRRARSTSRTFRVADTVIVLQALAARRELAVVLDSELLP